MTVALFRKWRSQSFRDLVGQGSAVQALKGVIESGSIARGYLFAGPRGTGKTSSARIFAKAINCLDPIDFEPCNTCAHCVAVNEGRAQDVFEIDAASHTQVDKIREYIIDRVYYAPSVFRYKVYIIDEVHKLSSSSFNALLKTLEEPPEHVVFILATTDPQQVPATILSRCQRYEFNLISLSDIIGRMKEVALLEDMSFSDDAFIRLARAANGSLRDGLVLLEQAHLFGRGKEIEASDVAAMLGSGSLDQPYKLLEAVADDEFPLAMNVLNGVVLSGCQLSLFVEDLVRALRSCMLLSLKVQDQEVLEISQTEVDLAKELLVKVKLPIIFRWIKAFLAIEEALIKGSDPKLLLELTIAELMAGVQGEQAVPSSRPKESSPSGSARSPEKKLSPRPSLEDKKRQEVVASKPAVSPRSEGRKLPTEEPQAKVERKVIEDSSEFWSAWVDRVGQVDLRLKAVLNSGRLISFGEGAVKVELESQLNWHKSQLESKIDVLIQEASFLMKEKPVVSIVLAEPVEGGVQGGHQEFVAQASRIFGIDEEGES